MGSVKYQLLLCTLPGEQPLPGTITARGLRLELICGSYKNPISDILPCAAAAKKGGGSGPSSLARMARIAQFKCVTNFIIKTRIWS